MPARRLDPERSESVRLFDVCGQDSDDDSEFVRHVGLCGEDQTAIRADQVAVPLIHMGPPLRRDESKSLVQSVGSAELTSDQLQQIRLFVDELESEYTAQKLRSDTRKQYIIHPHVLEPNDETPCRRFNCAGFVIEAYRDAGIALLPSDLGLIPAVTINTITRAYPDSGALLNRPSFRSNFGLEGDGPWPVILAGYVINALNRDVAAIRAAPYVPQVGDEYFPPRR